jgi:NAD+ synthase
VSEATAHPRGLDLPRDETGLATSATATRRLEELLPEFLRSLTEDAGADRLVVTLDGGLDTSLAAALAVDAVGTDRVIALVMPARLSDEASAREAEAVASMLGVDYRRVPLQPVLTAFQSAVGTANEPADDVHAVDNALERFRMACAYYVANVSNGLVVGALDRTDRLVGTPTKYGDTGVDCHLLGDLYRTEVRALADRVGVPEEIRDRQPRRGFRSGTATDRLDIDAETLDRLLRRRIDEGRDAETVAREVGVDTETVTRVAEWCATTRHKRHQPPKPSTYV